MAPSIQTVRCRRTSPSCNSPIAPPATSRPLSMRQVQEPSGTSKVSSQSVWLSP